MTYAGKVPWNNKTIDHILLAYGVAYFKFYLKSNSTEVFSLKNKMILLGAKLKMDAFLCIYS